MQSAGDAAPRIANRASLPTSVPALPPATNLAPPPTRNPAASSFSPLPSAISRALASLQLARRRPARTRMRDPPTLLGLPCKSLSQCRSRGGRLHPLILPLARSRPRQFPATLAASLPRHPIGDRRDWIQPRPRLLHQSPVARRPP